MAKKDKAREAREAREARLEFAQTLITRLAQGIYDMGGRICIENGDGCSFAPLTYDAVFEIHDKSKRPCVNDK